MPLTGSRPRSTSVCYEWMHAWLDWRLPLAAICAPFFCLPSILDRVNLQYMVHNKPVLYHNRIASSQPRQALFRDDAEGVDAARSAHPGTLATRRGHRAT